MKKEDARKLTTETQEQLRKQGKTHREIAVIVGVIRIRFGFGGRNISLKAEVQTRGRRKGAQHSLDISQAFKIQKLIRDNTPLR